MTVNWRNLILAWLHNPPDTVLNLARTRTYAAYYEGAALGEEIPEIESIQKRFMALEDGLPIPMVNGHICQVGFFDESNSHSRSIIHPLTGDFFPLPIQPPQSDLTQQIVTNIADLTQHCPDAQSRFLALWRFLPERLAALSPAFALLPADPGVPDHSIWNHADLQAALAAATGPEDGGALLSFTLGPVQGFIEQARSLRDLWSGSYILSWLTFQSMQPVLAAYGPTALIFPSLRGNPLYDLALYRQYPQAPFTALQFLASRTAKASEKLLTGSFPNTFLALVSAADAEPLAGAIEQACRQAWQKMCDTVRKALEKEWRPISPWTNAWQQQVEHFWDIRTVALPLRPSGHRNLGAYFTAYLGEQRWPPVATLAHLQQMLSGNDGASSAAQEATPPGVWMLHMEMLGRVLAASKQVRHIPPHAQAHDDRAKCTLMGTFEQMGPGGGAAAQRTFWERAAQKPLGGTHVRRNERLCAIALVKRFCWAAYFADYFDQNLEELRFSDTATIAAYEWLQRADIDPQQIRRKYHEWSGQWLFQDPRQWENSTQEDLEDDPFPQNKELQEKLREALRETAKKRGEGPRPYYAAFVMDGDRMGEWLSGKQAPQVQQAYHPELVEVLRQYPGAHATLVEQALTSKRPLSPVLHTAITAALGNFAQHFVPEIVAAHHGELIYAGGDDALALLPTRDALPCLDKLRHAYSGTGKAAQEASVPDGWAVKDGRFMMLMGATATVSAGVAIAHYKADLREVLQAARQAESAAKQAGRAALGIALLRRSGEHSQVVCPWNFVETLQQFVHAFGRASDRWAYHLRGDLETLSYLDKQAIADEIARAVNHGDLHSRRLLASHLARPGQSEEPENAGALVAGAYLRLWSMLTERAVHASRSVEAAQRQAFEDFIALVQVASFLARGRERE